MDRAEQYVVDTGPLYDFLALSIAGKRGWSPQGVSNVLRDPDARRGTLKFFARDARFFTTPAVLAQVERHAQDSSPRDAPRDEHRRRWWSAALPVLTQQALREMHISLLAAEKPNAPAPQDDEVQRFGPTDAELIAIARERLVPVLTLDQQLWNYCRKNDLRAYYLLELLPKD